MIGQVEINNNDIFTTWGATLVKGGYEKLLLPPPMKDYIKNTSRLQNGNSVIVHAPRTDSRSVQLQFFIEGNSESDYLNKYERFVDELQKGEIALKVFRLKTIYKLVYKKCSQYGNYGLKMGKFTVEFEEPNIDERIKL